MTRLAVAPGEGAIRDCTERAHARRVDPIGRRPAPMAADFAALIADGGVRVALRDGAVADHVVFDPEGRRMILDSVAVHPEMAGQGIGRTPVETCEAEARRLGLDAPHLFTDAKMTAKLMLYPHLGHVETARARQDSFDRVLFGNRP